MLKFLIGNKQHRNSIQQCKSSIDSYNTECNVYAMYIVVILYYLGSKNKEKNLYAVSLDNHQRPKCFSICGWLNSQEQSLYAWRTEFHWV